MLFCDIDLNLFQIFCFVIIEVGDESLKVVKYKKNTKGRYNVVFDDGHEALLYEDVILKFELLIKKEISLDDFIKMDEYNQECDVYYIGLNKLKNRFRSVNDLREILLKLEYPRNLVDKAVEKLLSQGYLNDREYVKSYIHSQLINNNKGPYLLEKELSQKKIDQSIIREEMTEYSDDLQREKIDKIIKKELMKNHSSGGVVLKQKIYNSIKQKGFDINILNGVINNYSFGSNKDIYKKEYEKYYKKYSKKYVGKELERKVREKLYMKGLYCDED